MSFNGCRKVSFATVHWKISFAFWRHLSYICTVRAGLTWWINNGMVEGQVTKLKLIKRQMYGKAGFPLLRQRVLHAL